MAKHNKKKVQLVEPEITTDENGTEVSVAVVKTKKELKKERKEIKKHKKEVKKEAKKHSAKTTKAYRFLVNVVSLVVIAAMITCTVMAVQITQNLDSVTTSTAASADSADTDNSSSQDNSVQNTPATSSTPVSSDASDNSASSDDNASSEDASDANAQGGDTSADDGATTPLGSKADVVEYFKTAHAKVLSEAKSVTRTYDNTLNYNEYLEVGGNSTLAGVAKTLMGMFMEENTTELNYTGADIATNFPPTNNSCSGLTADMIGEYSVTEEGDNYIITLTINSSEENPDLGDYSANLVNIVESKTVEDAAAGYVDFAGLENRYFAPTVTATINKESGQMTNLELDTPSYMCFESATVVKIITVKNVGIGLEYLQKWTVEW